MGATVSALKTSTTQFLLTTVHPAAISSMSTMLAIRLKDDQQKIFTEALQEADTDTKKFWTTLKEKGFTEATIKQLQLDGKMGYLTGQNAPLIKKAYEKYQITAEEHAGAKRPVQSRGMEKHYRQLMCQPMLLPMSTPPNWPMK